MENEKWKIVCHSLLITHYSLLITVLLPEKASELRFARGVTRKYGLQV